MPISASTCRTGIVIRALLLSIFTGAFMTHDSAQAFGLVRGVQPPNGCVTRTTLFGFSNETVQSYGRSTIPAPSRFGAIQSWDWWNRVRLDSVKGWLPLAVSFTVSLFLLFVLFRRSITSSRKQAAALQTQIGKLSVEIDKLKVNLGNTKRTLDPRINLLQDDLRVLEQKQQAILDRLASDSKEPKTEAKIPELTLTNQPDLYQTQFPSSVVNYLKYADQNRLSKTEAKLDVLRGGNLVPASEGDFVIMNRVEGNSDGQIVIPHVTHFSSSEEFSIYFRNYFDCDAPSSGEVWIVRPALVKVDDKTGGWRLADKGLLEIK